MSWRMFPLPFSARGFGALPRTKARILPHGRGAFPSLPTAYPPVSASTSKTNDASAISIVDSPKTRGADFALRVSGDSMEPRYRDGDILLVSSHAEVAPGELGIFICDGEGYFKKFGGDNLISLNPRYAPIPLSAFEAFSCRGKVLGVLKQKS